MKTDRARRPTGASSCTACQCTPAVHPVTCTPCGHNYCAGCTGGYERGCASCSDAGGGGGNSASQEFSGSNRRGRPSTAAAGPFITNERLRAICDKFGRLQAPLSKLRVGVLLETFAARHGTAGAQGIDTV